VINCNNGRTLSEACTVLRHDRSSDCSGSRRQISGGVSAPACGRLSRKRKGISLALQNAEEDFGMSPVSESHKDKCLHRVCDNFDYHTTTKTSDCVRKNIV